MFRSVSYGFLPKCFGSHAIIGNPPYQVLDGGGTGASATPIYHRFIEISKKIQPSCISMIIPAKWYTGGKGLDDFRAEMLNDKRIAFIADFEDSRQLFPTADIAGGICYFNWLSTHKGLCSFVSIKGETRKKRKRNLSNDDVFVRDLFAHEIINKVKSLKEVTMDNVVFSRKPFGFASNGDFTQHLSNKSIRIFTSKGWQCVNRTEISSNIDQVHRWKVIMSKTGAEHAGQSDSNGMKRVISRIMVIAPDEICSESYLLLSCFDNQEEAENLLAYMRTRFVRFLLSSILLTQNIAKDKFKLIPLQDFTHCWNDKELYKKYDLTSNEIEYIESLIKPM